MATNKYFAGRVTSNPILVPATAEKKAYAAFGFVQYFDRKPPRYMEVRAWGNAGRNLLKTLRKDAYVTVVSDRDPLMYVYGKDKVETILAVDVLAHFRYNTLEFHPSQQERETTTTIGRLPVDTTTGEVLEDEHDAAAGS